MLRYVIGNGLPNASLRIRFKRASPCQSQVVPPGPRPICGFLHWALPQSFFPFVIMEMLAFFPQLDALEFLHENEYVHGNVTAKNIFVNPEDLSQVIARSPPPQGLSGPRISSATKPPCISQCLPQTKDCYPSYAKGSFE